MLINSMIVSICDAFYEITESKVAHKIMIYKTHVDDQKLLDSSKTVLYSKPGLVI